MRARIWILVVLVLATAGYTRFLSDVHPVPLNRPLGEVPMRIAEWQGQGESMEDRIVEVVGVEDYLMRGYSDGAGASVNVYVGFYEQQREGDQIHSPKHCLPGAGWQPTQNDTIEFATPGINGGTTHANRYVIAKGDSKQLVLYWYQSRGRDITNEYMAKIWLVVDSIFRKRNDGALVRFIVPIPRGSSVSEAQARAVSFAQAFLPELARTLPG